MSGKKFHARRESPAQPSRPGPLPGTGEALPVTLLIVAKAPVAGFAKTRLCPPLTPVQAARLAAAALSDTLDAVLACRPAHQFVAVTGDFDRAEYRAEIRAQLADFEIIDQRGSGFDVRLANAHADAARAGLPVLQIGMDTPQVTAEILADAAHTLADGRDAVLGPATDGGWWALGLTDPRAARLLVDVPMSTGHTGADTRNILRSHGYRVASLPTLTDVDHYADALEVAAGCGGRFATEVRGLTTRRVAT